MLRFFFVYIWLRTRSYHPSVALLLLYQPRKSFVCPKNLLQHRVKEKIKNKEKQKTKKNKKVIFQLSFKVKEWGYNISRSTLTNLVSE